MHILVCGSREFNDYGKLKTEVLAALPIGDYIDATVISGHARGADKLGERLAVDMGWKSEVYPADWNTWGKAAGPIRNKQMLIEGKPDLVIAFLAKDSIGTKDMIKQSKEAKVEVVVVNI